MTGNFVVLLLLFAAETVISYSVDLRNPVDLYRCRGEKDYDLKSFDYWDIYASGRMQTSLCRMTFESESYPYQLMVEIAQPIRAKTNSKFFILFQTRNSKHMPWSGDTKLTVTNNLMGPFYFDRRLALTISGDMDEDVSFRIRIRTKTTSNTYNVGVVSGLANWAVGVIVSCLLVFLCFGLCGLLLFRRYRGGQGFSLIPGYFSRPQQPYVVTYSGNDAALLQGPHAPPLPIYPTGQPPYPTQSGMYTMPPHAGTMAGPPLSGFVYPPAPPPYSAVPPPPMPSK